MKIIIVEDEADLGRIVSAALTAQSEGKSFRVCVDGDRVKVKVGGGMWTYGFGKIDPDSDYAYNLRHAQDHERFVTNADPLDDLG